MGMDHRFHPSSTSVAHRLIGATILSLFASGIAGAQQRDTAQVAQAQARVTQAYALPEPSFGASIVGRCIWWQRGKETGSRSSSGRRG
jgi:hypothetical protein